MILSILVIVITGLTYHCHKNKTARALSESEHINTDFDLDSNQAYMPQGETKQNVSTVDCIDNQDYIIHSDAGTMECIDLDTNQAYVMADTIPTDFNVAYVTTGDIKVEENRAYGTNTVLTEPNVAYGTQPHSQITMLLYPHFYK